MNRFEKKHRPVGFLSFLAPLLVFILVLTLFLNGLSALSENAGEKESENLREAVLRGAVQCYALEGFYPEDLSYLEEHYGIVYDRSRYVVAYEAAGANLMPDVTVLPLENREESP